ncbi:MAG: hypothetical protein ACK5W9_09055 [Bdellovibrionales bacterium]
MGLFFRIATIDDLNEISEYEKKKLIETTPDPMERELQSWHAKWRMESLQQHLPLGWSFLARDPDQPSPYSSEGLLVGYFLAQPLLFFDGQTQSLWLEHLSYSSLQARDQLCDLSYRLSREKHFQRVYFPLLPQIQNAISHLKPEAWSQTALFVKTSKANS